MSAPETVMQRALREAEVMTPEDEAWVARWRADWFRDVAIEYLKSQGVKPIGDNSIVEYAIGRAAADVEAAHQLLIENAKRSPGRPRIGYDISRIYAAAYFAHADDGISETQRMLAAARFLGHPATKDRVVRGVKAFCRYEALFTSAAYTEHRQAARNFLLNLVVDQKHDLLRIAAELEQEKEERASRRYAERHGAVFTRRRTSLS